jgi:hypothetical protein
VHSAGSWVEAWWDMPWFSLGFCLDRETQRGGNLILKKAFSKIVAGIRLNNTNTRLRQIENRVYVKIKCDLQ